MGLNHMLIQSNGDKVENPRTYGTLKSLSYTAKIFARKQKESKSYQRQKLSVAFIHEKCVSTLRPTSQTNASLDL